MIARLTVCLLFLAPTARGDEPPAVPVNEDAKQLFWAPGPEDRAYPLPQDPERIKAVRAARLAAARRVTVLAFEQYGDTKAKWADKARAALEASARYIARFGTWADDLKQAERAALEAALAAGCDDPLVRYFAVNRHSLGAKTPEELRAKSEAVYTDLAARKHPPYRLALAAMHAWQKHFHDDRRLPDVDPTPAYDRCLAGFVAACRVNDRETDELLVDLAHDIISTFGWAKELGGREVGYRVVFAAMDRGKASDWLRNMVVGDYSISHAWEARGGGTADTVTEDGFAAFKQRLRTAEQELTAAWKARPDAPGSARRMIQVAIGLGYERAEMETWFKRAMEADPDDLMACIGKADYLHPKWHGTLDDYEAFMRQCVRTRNDHGALPMVVVQHYFHIVGNPRVEAAGANTPAARLYLRESFEPFLRAHPDSRPARAWYFCLCVVWNELDAAEYHLKKLGGPSWEYSVWHDRTVEEFYDRYLKAGGKPVPVEKK